MSDNDIERRIANLEKQTRRRIQYLVARDQDVGIATHGIFPSPLTVAMTTCAYVGGQPQPGIEDGPAFLKEHFDIQAEIKQLGWAVHDLGHVTVNGKWNKENDPRIGGLNNPRQVGEACELLYNAIKPNLGKELALTIGGDHSLAIGSITAALEYWKDLRVIWVDTHGDVNTETTSPTGNIHGMPIAFLCGFMKDLKNIPGFEWFAPHLDPKRIAYIGLRDVDYYEKKIIQDHGIKAFSTHEIDKYGMGKVVEMAMAHLNPDGKFPIHLSFDIDAIDPTVCPSTGLIWGGGLTYREASYICEAVAATKCLVGLDLVELNPSVGTHEDVLQTGQVLISLLRSCLGHQLLNVQL